ncbi:MAG TPA: type II toxin-antitoxin system VapC family toxin [Saprospiraceae bacterium]|nr:type II toxin-antitoxin system VapC family toxin [Saprospiraceae bacterium]HRJ13726.1 type II toxin-antitoxin system VapC family toxin [Saprospiraceae bacterium]HRK81566.1 type II toxin-antitoxin system VapC family toxin [Saprospiraceae bacterium]
METQLGYLTMVLCDTNIFISAFNGRQNTIDQLGKIGLNEILLSAVTVMELFQGMGNKKELAQMKKKIKFYDVIQIDEHISTKAIEFIETFRLSHGLQIPDAIIGATAIVYQIPLYTYNVRDFDFLPDVIFHQPV